MGLAATTQQPFRPQTHCSADLLAWVCSLGHNSTALQPLELSMVGHGNLAPGVFSLGLVALPYPTKIYIDHFFPNHSFNVKYIPIKRQHHPPPIVFAPLCGRACQHSVRCLQPHLAPPKFALIIFSQTIHLMPNASQLKKQPHALPTVFAPLCGKGSSVITLL